MCETFHIAGIVTMDVFQSPGVFSPKCGRDYGMVEFIYFVDILKILFLEHCEMTCPSCNIV